MSAPKKPAPLRVTFNNADLTDPERVNLAGAVGVAAPISALYNQHPAVKAALDAFIAAGVSLGGATTVVRDLEQKLGVAKETVDLSRTLFGQASTVARTTVETTATTLEEVASVGLTGRFGRAPAKAIAPPTGVAIHLGKKHGQFRASAVYTGRAKYGAQVSTDPVGPATWQDLPGSGKERTVMGHPSGTLVWVRFRTLGKNSASEWCTPVAVTVP